MVSGGCPICLVGDMRPISDKIFVNGELRAAYSDKRIIVDNPALGERLGTIPDCSTKDVDDAVEAADRAFIEWSEKSNRDRAGILYRLASLLRDNIEAFSGLDTEDSGRTLRETQAQVSRSAEQLEYCAGIADKLEGRVIPIGGSYTGMTVLEPYGVIGALTPWNAPLLQVAQKVSHILAAGNTVVVKPSPLACFTTLHFAILAQEAGLPNGVLNIVTGGRGTGEAVVADNRVQKITFTGSIATGRAIASECGKRGASVSLELGGKCPLVIFADSDLPTAVEGAAQAAYGTTGQSCVSAARILVEESIFDEFVQRFSKTIEEYRSADPLDQNSTMGPMISRESRTRVVSLVEDALLNGARIAGGVWPQQLNETGGYFMQPVALVDVPDCAKIVHDEIFGPVTCLERFIEEDDALSKANFGPYGLAAGIFTSNSSRARRMQKRIKAGNVWINCYKMLDPALPFGGDKSSGIARECGVDGILNFVKPKTIVEAF